MHFGRKACNGAKSVIKFENEKVPRYCTLGDFYRLFAGRVRVKAIHGGTIGSPQPFYKYKGGARDYIQPKLRRHALHNVERGGRVLFLEYVGQDSFAGEQQPFGAQKVLQDCF
jgi:hypothetical protein